LILHAILKACVTNPVSYTNVYHVDFAAAPKARVTKPVSYLNVVHMDLTATTKPISYFGLSCCV